MPKNLKWRSLLIGGLFTLFFVGIVGRLYWVQVVRASWLLDQAQVRWEADRVITPVRGDIVDRHDKVLAEDAPAYTVAISPRLIDAYHIEDDVARGLAAILNTSDDSAELTGLQDKIRKLAEQKKKDGTLMEQVEIKNEGWKIDKDLADQVKQFRDDLMAKVNQRPETKSKVRTSSSLGIYLEEDKKRYYPGGQLAAHVIGYNNKEGQAVMGIEAQMDSDLKGVPGRINYEKDANGVELPDAKVTIEPAVDGKQVRLTIDKNIQFYMENAMAKIADKFHPKSMAVIAADPRTMEILGMASYPTFDPNKYWLGKPSATLNRTIAAQFEPGSTFKLVTLAGAVKEGLFHPNDTYQSGSIVVRDRRLHDWNDVGWGKISYLDGLKRSSNVAFVKLGYEMLGPEKLLSYITSFGFGAKTDIDLAGELPGIVRMRYDPDYATATYGQGLTVTAIQEAAAYGAIANGGKLMWPHVIKDIVDPKTGQVVKSFEPKVVRQIIDEATAKQVTGYLEQVVSDQNIGTGKNAYIDGYRIAGKTGTANFVDPKTGKYAEGRWNISFAGYAPADNPQILITIIVEDPELGGDFHKGSEVGPPLFRDIMAQSLKYLGIPPEGQPQKQAVLPTKEVTLSVPNLIGMTEGEAKEAAGKYGLKLETLGKGDNIVKQFPLPGAQITGSQHVAAALQEGDLTLPDLTGRSLREAIEMCTFVGVSCRSSGTGYVVSQSAGDGGAVALELRAPDQAPPAAADGDGGQQQTAASGAGQSATAEANAAAGKTAAKKDTAAPPSGKKTAQQP